MKIITHSGSFQADDIFAVAILILAIGESQVVRTRDQDQIIAADYVVASTIISPVAPARGRTVFPMLLAGLFGKSLEKRWPEVKKRRL